MKNYLLMLLAAATMIACKKELKKNTQSIERYQLVESSEVLEDRLIETVEDIATEQEDFNRNSLRWLHVARLMNPESGSSAMQVKDVVVNEDMAYVLYASTNGKNAAIDVLNLSTQNIPSLVSSLKFNELSLTSMVLVDNSLIAFGKNNNQGVLCKIELEAGKLTNKVVEKTISANYTALVANEGKALIASEAGLLEVNTTNLEVSTVKVDAKDVANKVVYKGQLSTIASTNLVELKDVNAKSASATFLPIKAVKVSASADYLLVADEFGQVNIVEGISSSDYLKCKKGKKDEKDDRDKKKKGKKGKSDKGDKDNDSNSDCQCEGKMKSFTFKYDGPSGVTIYVYNKNYGVIGSFTNVQKGASYTANGYDDRGRFDSKTYLGETAGNSYEVHTSCSIDILDDVYGPFTITAYVDSEGSVCESEAGSGDSGSDDDDTDNDDGSNNNNTSCQCEGRMESFTFYYGGPTGQTIQAWNKKSDYLITTIDNAQNGQFYTISGFDRHGRLESWTNLTFSDGSSYAIHTSCSIDILDEVFGPIRITAYVDGQGSACETSNPPITAQKLTQCSVVGADPGYAFFQAVWLDDFFKDPTNGNLFDRGYRFEGGSGVFKELPDGKAVLSGVIYSPNYPNNRWDMTVYFKDKSTWAEWSALGKTYKKGAGYITGAHENWTYYMMDESRNNVMIGLGDNAGFTSVLTQRPSNLMMGFQIGEGGANDKNSAYGMAGWFYYTHPDGSIKHADWNLDVVNCTTN